MNETYLSRNMSILEKKIPNAGNFFSSVSISKLKIDTAKSGVPTLLKQLPNSQDWIQFHSKYDPEKEARDQISKLEFEKVNFCVVFGFGLGYATEHLLKSCSSKLKILVMEPDTSVFYMTMISRDISSLLSSPRVTFFLGNDIEKFYSFCKNFFQLSAIKNLVTLDHPPSFRFHNTFFENAKETIRSHIIQTAENLLTLMEEGGGYQVNTLMSIGEIITKPGVTALFDQFKEVPAVIVSAGPSLDKNVYLLNKAKDNVIIIAVDTAVKPLLGYGIKPHLVVTADPSFENYTHISWCSTDDFYLVAEPMAYPSGLKRFSKKLFIASFNDRIMEYLQKFIGDKGKLKAWGSVSAMAFDLAKMIGSAPIIFIGQDLAYSGGKTYCANTEHDGVVLSAGCHDMKTHFEQKDIFGFPVTVEQQHYTYANYLMKEFETMDAFVINATEGGILKKNVKIMSLKEALFRYAKNKVAVTERLDKIHKESLSHPPPLGMLEADLKKVVRSMKRIDKECSVGIRYVFAHKKRSEKKKMSLFDIKCILSEIQRIKSFISKEKIVLPFLEMAGQKALFSFQRGFQELEGRNIDLTFLKDALNTYGNLFNNVREVLTQILPSFEMAYKEVASRKNHRKYT